MKKISLKVLLPAVCAAALLSGAISAHAQSIDYASLETLFGEPVTTSATGKPQRVSEAPVAMTILTADDIRRSGAKDLAEVLRSVSGVNVMQHTRRQHDVGIRGYNTPFSSSLLVLVNGRQVYLDHYGYTAWQTIPVQLEEIRQIEIVKGPNTALFGFNAANGVINIVTANPLYDDTASVGVTGGTGSYREAHFIQTFKGSDKMGIRVSGGASKSDEFDGDVNGVDLAQAFTSPEKRSVNVDSIIQVNSKSQIRLEASSSNIQETEMTPYNLLASAEYDTNALKAGYESDTAYGLVKATVYKNWANVTFAGTPYDPSSILSIHNDVTVAQLENIFKIGIAHAFRVQMEYRHNQAWGSAIGPIDAVLQDDVYAFGGMWGWTITDQWELTNSARVDRLQLARTGSINAFSPLTDSDYDQNVTAVSYNSGLVWKATPTDTLRFNTGRGFRIASLTDLGITLDAGAEILGFPSLQIGNPRLNPTVVTSYELEWDRKIAPINGLFKAGVFTTNIKDVVDLDNASLICTPFAPPCNAAAFVAQVGNAGSSNSVGAEFTLKGKINENWRWEINDTIQKISDDYYNALSNSEDMTPINMANVHIGYQKGRWEADAFAHYVSSFSQPEPPLDMTIPTPLVEVPAYVSVSGRVGYKVGDTTFSLSGQELQSAEATRTRGPDVERRLFASIEHRF